MKFVSSVNIIACMYVALGQEPSSFDVASIRRAENNRPGQEFLPDMLKFHGGPGSKTPGRIDYRGVTLKSALARAYDLRTNQIIGPDWIDSERYDIVAKFPPDTQISLFRVMLQNLLNERFSIRSHKDVKRMSMYKLVVSRSGAKLKSAAPLVEPSAKPDKAALMEKLREQVKGGLEASTARIRNGNLNSYRSFGLTRASLTKFAQTLSNYVDLPVKDDTNIAGEYDFNLTWVAHGPPQGSPKSEEPTGPSIFAALEEQLGLRLQAEKNQVEIFILDAASKAPLEN